MMLLFSPGKRCGCPCSDAVLRSCEAALAGTILHRPPSLWFAWVRSGCAGPLGAGAARAQWPGPGGGGIPWGPGTREDKFLSLGNAGCMEQAEALALLRSGLPGRHPQDVLLEEWQSSQQERRPSAI